MKKIIGSLKHIQLSKVLTAFLVGLVFLFTTACNTGNEVGARPEVPPVQMGGQNNPYKAGGDSYTKYRMSTDPNVKNADDQASLQGFDRLIAANDAGQRSDGLLYPGSQRTKSAGGVDDFVSPQRQRELNNPGQIPAQPQPIVNRSNPDAKILEKVGQTFKDASQFLNNDATNDRAEPNLKRAVE